MYLNGPLPYLNYCSENWGNTEQKTIIRIINKATFTAHDNILFRNLKILKLKNLIEMKTAIFMYNVCRKSLPSNLLAIFDI